MRNEYPGRNSRMVGVRFSAPVAALVAVLLFCGCSLSSSGGPTTGGTISSGGVSTSTAPAAGSVAAGGSDAMGGSS